MRVLVVDDEPAVGEALERALGLEGYEVARAGDGLEALAAIDSEPPDAVILDILMPRLDGLVIFALMLLSRSELTGFEQVRIYAVRVR